jgi:hypothetical protein
MELAAEQISKHNTMATVSITSNDGALQSVQIERQRELLEPLAHIVPEAPGVRLGKYEIAVQSDKLQINGRDASDAGFETIVVLQRTAAGGNIGLEPPANLEQDKGVVAIANASVVPSGNPAGGGILYVEDGALRYRGSNGAITTVAPAQPV